MKRALITLAVLALALTASPARSEEGLGIGIMVGEPTGLSLKKWISPTRAVDAGIAWSFTENDSFHFHADYLLHSFDALKASSEDGRLAMHYGLGARVKLKDDNGRGRNDDDALVGIRFPIGLSYLFSKAPFDIFGELVPILDVAPGTDFSLNAAIGARFYFR